ncbi:MAG: phage tail protein, partial [Proteobacteria bacterium]|nr:phage tail protein [Pseudomonadota bacterium]
MAQDFFSIVTVRGHQKRAAALAGGPPVQLTHMAVGDGRNGAYYSPTNTQVALENEVYRAQINELYQHQKNKAWIVSELAIPDEVGGFYVREVGIFDSDGELFAIGKYPESFKPIMASGAGKQLLIRQIFENSNADSVTLIIDPSIVTATRQYVDELLDVAVGQITDRIDRQDAKDSARVATTGAVSLSGLQAIDGVALSPGSRVLVKDQSDASSNGIYIASAGAWARATDADTSSKVTPGLFLAIEEGDAHGGSMWQLVTPAPIVLDSTALQFVLSAGRTGVVAGNYIGVNVDDHGRVLDGSSIWVPEYLKSGDPLPPTDIGPIWHDDYNSWMTWQVFDANGAGYIGYASVLVGKPELDAQPTARKGFIPSGASNLSKAAYGALWNWAVHTGLLVSAGTWVAGTVAVKDNGDGTFAVYDLRGE